MVGVRGADVLNTIVRYGDECAGEAELNRVPVRADSGQAHLRHRLVSDVSVFETGPILELEDPQKGRAIHRTLRINPCGVMCPGHRIHSPANSTAVAIDGIKPHPGLN